MDKMDNLYRVEEISEDSLNEIKDKFKDNDIAYRYYRTLVAYDKSKCNYKKYAIGMAWCNILSYFSCIVYGILLMVIGFNAIDQSYKSNVPLNVSIVIFACLCLVGMIVTRWVFIKISDFLESKIVINKLNLNREDIKYLNFLLKKQYEKYEITDINIVDDRKYVNWNHHMYDVTSLLNNTKDTLELRKYYEIKIIDTTVIINDKRYERNDININYVSEITNK